MSVTTEKKRFTPDDLLAMTDAAGLELVDGELVEKNVSFESSTIAMLLGQLLGAWVRENQLGFVAGADCSYQCFQKACSDPNRIRKPDVSFIRSGRLTAAQFKRGHCPIPPDLAVEVVSPNDTVPELEQKIEEYLAAGVELIWVVNPGTRVVRVVRNQTDARLHESDELSGEDVIPGFKCQVAELFDFDGLQ